MCTIKILLFIAIASIYGNEKRVAAIDSASGSRSRGGGSVAGNSIGAEMESPAPEVSDATYERQQMKLSPPQQQMKQFYSLNLARLNEFWHRAAVTALLKVGFGGRELLGLLI